MSALRVRLLALLVPGLLLLMLLAREPGHRLPPRSLSSLDAWYERTGPAGVASVLLGLALVVMVSWIVVASALQLAATFSLRPGFGQLADAISPPVVRRLVRSGAGVAAAVGMAIGPVAAARADDPAGVAVMEALTSLDDTDPPAPVEPTSTTASQPQVEPPTASETSVLPPGQPPAASRRGAEADLYVVGSGDSFWSIAEEVLSEEDEVARDADLIAYWRQLIERNRANLIAPGNPDLLLPGQTLTLPPR